MSQLLNHSSRLLRALLVAIVIGVGAHTVLISQQPTPPAPATIDPAIIQSLQALKAANEKILIQQEGILQRLETLKEQTRQLRIFAKRT